MVYALIHFTINDGCNKWSKRGCRYRRNWSHSWFLLDYVFSNFVSFVLFYLFGISLYSSIPSGLYTLCSSYCLLSFVVDLKITKNVILNCSIFYFQTTRYKVIIMRLAILLVLFTLVASGYARFFCKYFCSVIICYFII